jgi:hypothetical protein
MWTYNYSQSSDELYHHGVKGMKWGKRKSNYRSTGVRAAIARKKNQKVDEGFDEWKENTKKRSDAIDLGKKANASKMAYENNRSDKNLKKQYKTDEKAYKKALSKNTTYRKGQVRKETGSDLSRKYLSEAKKVKKQLTADPSNKQLKKRYNELMSKHDIERAKARKAEQVAANRSRKKASMKRAMTMTVKAAAGTAAVAVGVVATNAVLSKYNVQLNGRPISINSEQVKRAIKFGKKVSRYI